MNDKSKSTSTPRPSKLSTEMQDSILQDMGRPPTHATGVQDIGKTQVLHVMTRREAQAAIKARRDGNGGAAA